ncbi:MAG: arylsulfatase [Sphingomonas sp.]|nr:MAG: arylsulfatase [Sphingomonas sp.]
MRSLIKRSLCALALSTTMLASAAQPRQVPSPSPAPASRAAAQRPNIILILSDDNSVPHDGCHPNATARTYGITPNFEAFAREGMCFDRAYSSASQCAPSRGAIFAGRNPVELGITRFAQPARRDVPYFSDLLRASGYWVGLDGRNHHLGGREDDPPHVKKLLAETGQSRLQDRFDYVNIYGTKTMPAATLAGQVGETLDKVPANKPFFLYFGFSTPHRPFVTPHQDIDPATLTIPPDWPDLPAVRSDYADMLADVRTMDRQFGALLAAVKARGLDKNTIIVFMGDNGESMYRGKGTLYERGNHVPLIVRWPGVVKPGSRNDALVSNIDLAETFLEAAGLKPDAKMTGISFAPLLRGASDNGRHYVFTERGWHPGGLTVSEGVDFGRAITGTRYKLIYNAQPDQPYSPVDQGGRFLVRNPADQEHGTPEVQPGRWASDEARALGAWKAVVVAHQAKALPQAVDQLYFKRPRPIFELYDIQADPYELKNLEGRPDLKGVETELRQQLDLWMVSSGDYLPLATDAYRETPDPTRP